MNKELVVLNKQMPIISINFDEVEQELQGLLTTYTGLEVTEETLPACKDVQKRLAKLGKEINQRKIDIKKELSAPIVEFETRCKKLIAMVDDVNKPIKEGLQVFEDKRKAEKRAQIQFYIDSKAEETGLLPKYASSVEISEGYLNVTAKLKDIQQTIDRQIELLKNQQEEAIRNRETVIQHIAQVSEMLDLSQPFTTEEFNYLLNQETIDVAKAVSEINQKAKYRKEAETKAVEKANEVKAVEQFHFNGYEGGNESIEVSAELDEPTLKTYMELEQRVVELEKVLTEFVMTWSNGDELLNVYSKAVEVLGK